MEEQWGFSTDALTSAEPGPAAVSFEGQLSTGAPTAPCRAPITHREPEQAPETPNPALFLLAPAPPVPTTSPITGSLLSMAAGALGCAPLGERDTQRCLLNASGSF